MLDVNIVTVIVTFLIILCIILVVSTALIFSMFITLKQSKLQSSNPSETSVKSSSDTIPLTLDRLARAQSELMMYVLKALSNSKS